MRPATMRASTWLWAIAALLTVVAETVYAVEGDTDLQGRALGLFVILSLVLALYQLATGRRDRQ